MCTFLSLKRKKIANTNSRTAYRLLKIRFPFTQIRILAQTQTQTHTRARRETTLRECEIERASARLRYTSHTKCTRFAARNSNIFAAISRHQHTTNIHERVQTLDALLHFVYGNIANEHSNTYGNAAVAACFVRLCVLWHKFRRHSYNRQNKPRPIFTN